VVPGDISSAAFFLIAALLKPGSRVAVESIGLNPTRAALMDFLAAGGARIRVLNMTQSAGEIIGDILIEHSPWRGGVLEKAMTAALIDEIPVLAILGAVSK